MINFRFKWDLQLKPVVLGPTIVGLRADVGRVLSMPGTRVGLVHPP